MPWDHITRRRGIRRCERKKSQPRARSRLRGTLVYLVLREAIARIWESLEP
jgi:hypothetical protein